MRALFRSARVCLVVCLFLAVRAAVANAQCAPHPSQKATVSVINASSWPITFSIDGVRRATVPSADVSIDFNLSSGQHFLLAEASIDGEHLSISRRMVIPAGSMCVWTVTNPSKDSRKPPPALIDPLIRVVVIPLASPSGI